MVRRNPVEQGWASTQLLEISDLSIPYLIEDVSTGCTDKELRDHIPCLILEPFSQNQSQLPVSDYEEVSLGKSS